MHAEHILSRWERVAPVFGRSFFLWQTALIIAAAGSRGITVARVRERGKSCAPTLNEHLQILRKAKIVQESIEPSLTGGHAIRTLTITAHGLMILALKPMPEMEVAR